MLKTRVGNELWLISQPDHAAVSGYLAAYWGNPNSGFTPPGYFGDLAGAEAVRAEVVLAAAEHDNGWWEWEADPDLDPADGLPLHLNDLTHAGPERGFDRWRLGVPRLAEARPYAALLISFHAYWLYAFNCEDGLDPAFHHPLFKPGGGPSLEGMDLERARRFLRELHAVQADLFDRLRTEPDGPERIDPAALSPNIRLIQLFDGLSLALSFGGDKALRMPGIPRRDWNDRVDLELVPQAGRRIRIDPYPFDVDPLVVHLRARILTGPVKPRPHFHAWWHALPHADIEFTYCSAG